MQSFEAKRNQMRQRSKFERSSKWFSLTFDVFDFDRTIETQNFDFSKWVSHLQVIQQTGINAVQLHTNNTRSFRFLVGGTLGPRLVGPLLDEILATCLNICIWL